MQKRECDPAILLVFANLFQALGQWGRSKKRAGDEGDQRRAGSKREKTLPVARPLFRSSLMMESLEQASFYASIFPLKQINDK